MRGLVFIAGLAAFGAAASAQEREWTFDTGEKDAYLVFGVPETDDTGVSFWCPIASGEVHIFMPETSETTKPDQSARFEVTVAEKTFGYDGKTQVNEEAGVPSAEAVMDAKDAVFGALQAADRFSVKVAGREETYPVAGADFAALLRTCGKP